MGRHGFKASMKMLDKLPGLMISLFLAASVYSNAPAFNHSAFAIPIIISFVIILLWAVLAGRYCFSFGIGKIGLLCIFSLIFSFLFVSEFSVKKLMYFFAHLWFLLFAISLHFFVRVKKVSVDFRFLFFSVVPLTVLSCLEAVLPYWEVDIGSYIPRVERAFYMIDSGFGFFRSRGFNYESAYSAMYINVVFPILLHYFKEEWMILVPLWLFLLILTMSLFQIGLLGLLFLAFLLYLIMNAIVCSKNGLFFGLVKFMYKWSKWEFSLLSYVVITCFILLVLSNLTFWLSWIQAFYDWFFLNLSGGSSSAQDRLSKLNAALGFIDSNGAFGLGLGGIQLAGLNGISSFYLALIVQLGILAIPLFLFVGWLCYLAWRSGSVLIGCAFVCAFAHLLIVDTFYLPQVFVALIAVYLRCRDIGCVDSRC